MKKILIILMFMLIACSTSNKARYVPFEEFIEIKQPSIEKEKHSPPDNPIDKDEIKNVGETHPENYQDDYFVPREEENTKSQIIGIPGGEQREYLVEVIKPFLFTNSEGVQFRLDIGDRMSVTKSQRDILVQNKLVNEEEKSKAKVIEVPGGEQRKFLVEVIKPFMFTNSDGEQHRLDVGDRVSVTKSQRDILVQNKLVK
jgi:hypothetical protein